MRRRVCGRNNPQKLGVQLNMVRADVEENTNIKVQTVNPFDQISLTGTSTMRWVRSLATASAIMAKRSKLSGVVRVDLKVFTIQCHYSW